jgi:outer membrane protein assembly factor BamB
MLGLWGCLCSPAPADDWMQWRGPDANGVAVGESYPLKWTAEEGVLWKAALPGLGASTPIIFDDHILVTGGHDGKNSTLCLDRAGKQKWEVLLGDERAARNRKASGSNSSPVTDGSYLFVYFKSGDLACLNFQGEVLWHKNLQQQYGPDTLWWDLGTSPVLTKNQVVVAVMQSGSSYLVAMDKRTGDVAWKVDRNLDAPGEAAQSYTTPLVLCEGERETILVLGADHVTGHDGATGKQLWMTETLNPDRVQNYRSVSSPVVSRGVLVAPYSRGGSLTAFRLQGPAASEPPARLWESDGPAADVPTPVAHQERLFTITDRGRLAMLNLGTGEVIATADVPRSRAVFSASPVFAAGHLYVTNESGTTYVFRVGEQFELVAENKIDIFTIATPVFVAGRIYLRTDEYLFCIGS